MSNFFSELIAWVSMVAIVAIICITVVKCVCCRYEGEYGCKDRNKDD